MAELIWCDDCGGRRHMPGACPAARSPLTPSVAQQPSSSVAQQRSATDAAAESPSGDPYARQRAWESRNRDRVRAAARERMRRLRRQA